MRLLILTSIVTPYRTPVFDALSHVKDLQFRVLYLAAREPHRRWYTGMPQLQHAHSVLPKARIIKRHGSWIHVFSPGMLGELRRWAPDVVLAGGWDQMPHLVAFGARRVLGYRFAWWVESTLRDSRWSGLVATSLKERVARRADGVLVPGSASKEYVASLGVPAARIFIAPNAVESMFDLAWVDRSHRSGPVRFLFVGRLEAVKGIRPLLDAWQKYADPVHAELSIVGDGSLRDEIADRMERGDVRSVVLEGHLDRDALVDAYARADVFVMPSLSDPWGLVLNEATQAGLPIISSTAPGAVDDLVEDGKNGFLVPPEDIRALGRAIEQLTDDAHLRLTMGQHSKEISIGRTPAACAASIYRAIGAIYGGESRNPS